MLLTLSCTGVLHTHQTRWAIRMGTSAVAQAKCWQTHRDLKQSSNGVTARLFRSPACGVMSTKLANCFQGTNPFSILHEDLDTFSFNYQAILNLTVWSYTGSCIYSEEAAVLSGDQCVPVAVQNVGCSRQICPCDPFTLPITALRHHRKQGLQDYITYQKIWIQTQIHPSHSHPLSETVLEYNFKIHVLYMEYIHFITLYIYYCYYYYYCVYFIMLN